MFSRPFAKIVTKMIFFRIGNDPFTFLLHRNLLLLFNGQMRWIPLFPRICVPVWSFGQSTSREFCMKFTFWCFYSTFYYAHDEWIRIRAIPRSIKRYQCTQEERHFLWMIPTCLTKVNRVEWFASGSLSVSLFWMACFWLLSAAVPIYKFMVEQNYSTFSVKCLILFRKCLIFLLVTHFFLMCLLNCQQCHKTCCFKFIQLARQNTSTLMMSCVIEWASKYTLTHISCLFVAVVVVVVGFECVFVCDYYGAIKDILLLRCEVISHSIYAYFQVRVF